MSSSTSPLATCTDVSPIGFANWYSKNQYPDLKKKKAGHEDAQRNTLLNRNISKYNAAATIQNGLVVTIITLFVLTAIRFLNPIAGLLGMAVAGFVHFKTDCDMAGIASNYLNDKIVGWVTSVQQINGDKEQEFAPVSFDFCGVGSFYRLAPLVKTTKEESGEKSAENKDAGETEGTGPKGKHKSIFSTARKED